ncbi:rCG40764 [Rattus norvegicus]|uniref:RCG40764 n=1 Tax=Rattus norvegicus TaxID=10116 RepID=A6KP25_RAT|nr:rCG40764 [Rattus norvegicus]
MLGFFSCCNFSQVTVREAVRYILNRSQQSTILLIAAS